MVAANKKATNCADGSEMEGATTEGGGRELHWKMTTHKLNKSWLIESNLSGQAPGNSEMSESRKHVGMNPSGLVEDCNKRYWVLWP